jgi:hypothetical protein
VDFDAAGVVNETQLSKFVHEETDAGPRRAFVQRFFALTKGHVVIAGPRTFVSFPDWARLDRTVAEIHTSDDTRTIIERCPDRVVRAPASICDCEPADLAQPAGLDPQRDQPAVESLK